jgi:hypothetical protein
MKTPDDRVVITQQPPGRGPAGGATRYPLAGDRHPALDPQPDSRPTPRNPDDRVGRR